MHSKMMRYDRVVRKLNEYRKQGYAFGVISSFGEASVGAAGDSVSSVHDREYDILSSTCEFRNRLKRQKHGVYLVTW